MNCTFCKENLPLDTPAEQRGHFKTCTSNYRSSIRNLIKDWPDNSRLLDYHLVKRDFKDQTEHLNYTNSMLFSTTIKILRMWRANEILGRKNYLTQLESMPRLYPEDEQTSAEEIIDILEFMLQIHGGGDDTRAIMGLEDFFRGEDQGTPFHTSMDDSSGPADIDSQSIIDILDNYVDCEDPISEIARLVNWGRPLGQQLHPIAMSRKILQCQIDSQEGEADDFDDDQDEMLLELLGKGLPMVEVARLLNVKVEAAGYNSMRTQRVVEERVDELLAETPSPA